MNTEEKKTENEGTPIHPPLSSNVITYGPHKLERREDVFIFTMDNGENQFNDIFLAQLNAMLDVVESYPQDHTSLIITAVGKHFNTGLDLNWLRTLDNDHFSTFIHSFHLFLARYLALNCPTIAAINGHCIGGGGLWSAANDYRVMRSDKGFWCIPAVDIHVRLTEGFLALLKSKIGPPQLLRDVIFTGHKFGGDEAAQFKIVDHSVSEEKLISTSLELAQTLSLKNRHVFGLLKKELYKKVVAKLRNSGSNHFEVLSKF